MDPYDNTDERIQASYQKYQKDPADPAHSLAIATLYEQREEYANSIPWLEHALYLVRQRGDSVLEGRILDAQIRALKQDLAQFQAALDAENAPENRAQGHKSIDEKLDELNALLKMQKGRGRDPDQSN